MDDLSGPPSPGTNSRIRCQETGSTPEERLERFPEQVRKITV